VDGPVYNYVGHAKQLLMVDYPDSLVFKIAMVINDLELQEGHA
jgi:hypothetical protein